MTWRNTPSVSELAAVVKITEEEATVETVDHDLNKLMTMAQIRLPDDRKYQNQWHLHTRLTDPLFDGRSSSRCEEAWQTLGNFGSKDVVVGIADDGCLMNHKDFDSPNKFAGWAYYEGARFMTHQNPEAEMSRMYEEHNVQGHKSGDITEHKKA